ncbi:MAG: alginate export family protein [Bacteroidales bacterium]|nr:alginate export family protein [Bacteroidales bacterium]
MLTGSNLLAQFKLSGELRFRPEVRYGYKGFPDSNSNPAAFISQRSRLNFQLEREKLDVSISVQDVRVWGDEQKYSSTGIQGDDASIDLKEAWVRFKPTSSLSVQLGRQQFKYSDQRLLAARNWNQYGMSYDAILLSYSEKVRIDMGISYNNSGEISFQEAYSSDKIRMLNFLYLKKSWEKKIDLEGLYIQAGYQHPAEAGWLYLRHTVGGSVNLSSGKPYLFISGYYQDGKNKSGKPVSAWLLNAIAGYKGETNHVYAGTDIISGQNSMNNDVAYLHTDHSFDLLYGARHSKNGSIDFFSNLQKGTGGSGLVDLYLSDNCRLTDKFSLQLDLHYFRLQTDLAGENDLQGNLRERDKYLGLEADLKLDYTFSKEIQLEGGYSYLQGSETLCAIQGIPYDLHHDAHWVYVMLTVKPIFFKSN